MSYAVLRTGDATLDRNLDAIKQALDEIRALANIQGGKPIEDLVLGTSDTEVFHGLNKSDVRYVVVKRSANAVVYAGATASNRPSQSITLRASAAVTVDLVVY